MTEIMKKCQSQASNKDECYNELEIKITDAENLNVSNSILLKPREALDDYKQSKVQ